MQSTVAPLTDYFNSPIYQELLDEEDYFGGKSDERMYLDLRVSSGYVNETKSSSYKKNEANNLGLFPGRISVHIIQKWVNSQT